MIDHQPTRPDHVEPHAAHRGLEAPGTGDPDATHPGHVEPDTTPPGDGDPDTVFEAERVRGATARASLSPEERRVGAGRVIDRLLDLPELCVPGPRGVLAVSVSIRDELDLAAADDRLRGRGWRIAVPVVHEDLAMTFRVRTAGAPLVPGRWDIPVPVEVDGADLTAADLDVVVVPCVAVDVAGTRVGFGAGCYDRALAEPAGRPVVVMAVFDVQITDDLLPGRPWDVPGDVVVSDRRTIRPSGTAERRGRGPAGDGSAAAPAR